MSLFVVEEHTLRLAQRGDAASFNALKIAYQARVCSFCARLLRNIEEGEEAAQETFLLAWQNLSEYRFQGPFLGWLLKIARNTCLNLLRTKKSQERKKTSSLDDTACREAVVLQSDGNDTAQEGCAHAYAEQLLQMLRRRVTTQRPKWDSLDWSIFWLRVGQGEENFAQIALQVGCKVDTVKYRYRAHIQVALAGVRKEMVLAALYADRCALPWEALDWELLHLVYEQGMLDFDLVARRLPLSIQPQRTMTPPMFRHRYETVVATVISTLEQQLGTP